MLVVLVAVIGGGCKAGPHLKVQTDSMEPTIHLGETVTWSGFSPKRAQRGEIVVFHAPLTSASRGALLIKRIVGLPGDTVVAPNAQLVVDGTPVTERYLRPSTLTYHMTDPVVVPAGSYYVLGDNRNSSADSRIWGPIPATSMVGVIRR